MKHKNNRKDSTRGEARKIRKKREVKLEARKEGKINHPLKAKKKITKREIKGNVKVREKKVGQRATK